MRVGGLEPPKTLRFKRNRYAILYTRMVPVAGHDPAHLSVFAFEANASANSARRAIWCAKQDLNPHVFRRHVLSVVCLPIPPLAHNWCCNGGLNAGPSLYQSDALPLCYCSNNWSLHRDSKPAHLLTRQVHHHNALKALVLARGVKPLTSALRGQRSITELSQP